MPWASALSALAAGRMSRVWFFTAVLLLPLKRRVLRDLPIPVRLSLGGRAKWFWFSDSSELFALDEIFTQGEYATARRGRPGLIVDLGANVGQAALWFRTQFPEARMLCVEPDPRTFAKLKRNLDDDPLVTLRQAAITARDGSVQLQRTPDSSWGTRVTAPTSGGVGQVEAISLETLLDEHDVDHVDLLKVDIEGLEYEALAESPALARTTLVVGEIHPDLLSVSTDRALEDMRRCGGFDGCDLRGDIFVLSRRVAAGENYTAA